MAIIDKIMALTKQLYPTGRAFKFIAGGFRERLHHALALSEERAYLDALSILYNILPDNANFTLDDATAWERRLGLITNTSVPLSDRMLAIKRKINFPGTIRARQNYRYLQEQLQLAGFDVYVYENRFANMSGGYDTKTPEEVSGAPGILTGVQHGDVEHGEVQHGAVYNDMVVNHIDKSLDLYFDIGDNFRSTFFIGGNTLGSFANVASNREAEFRQLILRVKPVQTVAFLFVNYI